jgi:hypothetical protein
MGQWGYLSIGGLSAGENTDIKNRQWILNEEHQLAKIEQTKLEWEVESLVDILLSH